MLKPEKKSKLEFPDILLFLGLGLFFVGLGFAICWPWALVIIGAVLIGLAVWLVEPHPGTQPPEIGSPEGMARLRTRGPS